MEFVRGQISSLAGLSPTIENPSNVTMPAGIQGLHSRFNPKLVGFGIVSPFGPSSGTPVNSSPDTAVQTSYMSKHREILK